jgi:hypothetical protein
MATVTEQERVGVRVVVDVEKPVDAVDDNIRLHHA